MVTVAEHYGRNDVLEKVSGALERIAPGGARVDMATLAGFDHFHTAGVLATERMAALLSPSGDDTVLDAGAGIGGPARLLAGRFGCRVIGVDLTPEFVEVGDLLTARTGLDALVDLRVGDVTDLALDDASVDHAWTQHVAMNISDRPAFYAEVRRVLRPGGRFVSFDVVDGGGGELLLPVPWATEPGQTHLVTREEQRSLLEGAGFRVETEEDPAPELIPAMQQMLAAAQDAPLTTAMLIDDVETKGPTYIRNLMEGRTALSLVSCTAA